jgi:NAD(P)-dependent dehydrogenase (short-subunit alcohol dehydrogenase family)
MVVTGGGRGIGAAIATLAGERGYRVCVNYSRAKDRAEAVVGSIRAAGGEAIAVRADVGNEADVVAMFQEVDRTLGRVSALVNNAGIDHETQIVDLEVRPLERVFAVNVTGSFVCAREAIRRMSSGRGGGGGVIVNISSVSAKYGGLPGDVIYTATKGALDAFTLGLAREVAGQGIRVCCVRPGLTETEIFDRSIGLEAVKEMAAKGGVPLGRIAQPREVANLVLWLCSDEASYVTGAVYDVSGGR